MAARTRPWRVRRLTTARRVRDPVVPNVGAAGRARRRPARSSCGAAMAERVGARTPGSGRHPAALPASRRRSRHVPERRRPGRFQRHEVRTGLAVPSGEPGRPPRDDPDGYDRLVAPARCGRRLAWIRGRRGVDRACAGRLLPRLGARASAGHRSRRHGVAAGRRQRSGGHAPLETEREARGRAGQLSVSISARHRRRACL